MSGLDVVGSWPDVVVSGPDVVVLGSANLDVVFAVPTIPAPGETVLADGQARHPGGKGLNQAVASSRAGATTMFLGALGDDAAGDYLLAALVDSGVDAASVRRVAGPSGTAWIAVQTDGDNAIVVAPGANAALESLSDAERSAIADARVLVMQLEIPLSIVAEAAACARAAETVVVLNAAPAGALDPDLLRGIDVVVVNEHEGRTLGVGQDAQSRRERGGRERGSVVTTLGAAGARWVGSDGVGEVAAPPAEVVDTTGAGDTFTGVLAASLAAGSPLSDAVDRAVVAATISVETEGAVPSIPDRDQIARRMATR
ncbi:MAG TPA: ribokinase [Nocardioidaceae bacterium]|nr:ribokinase [Nocardioidaceae bacterium]